MTEPTGSRAEQKERTRRAILTAALDLCEDGPLAALSLRQVAKQVGIVPTAFYRHFGSIDELGLALVEESLASLRAMLRDVRQAEGTDIWTMIDNSVDILAGHVHRQRRHFAFIGRERMAGPADVREAIARGIELFERELVTDLAHVPGTDTWSAEDLHTLASLIVSSMVATAERLVDATPGSAEEERLTRTARTQLRMLLIGALNWKSSRA